jgi:hypothetical protein
MQIDIDLAEIDSCTVSVFRYIKSFFEVNIVIDIIHLSYLVHGFKGVNALWMV